MRRVDVALQNAALRFGDRRHAVEASRVWTFRELDAAVTGLSARFRELGVGQGRKVALTVANSLSDIAAVLAVWRAGAVLVPLDPRLGAAEAETLGDRADVCLRAAVSSDGELVATPRRVHGPVEDSELAAIAFTSGTTGSPKGVEITHLNLLWSANAVMHTRRDTAAAVCAVVSPLCHLPVFVSHYLARLLSGGSVVVARFDPSRLASMIADEGITDLPLVPAMVGPLLEGGFDRAASFLRKVTVGSALTPMETKRALVERFPRAEVLEAYGQTESTDGLTMTVGLEALERPGTVGRAHAITPVAIQDEESRLVPPGTPGEIVCHGPTVMRGYHGDPEATAGVLRGGWLHTGDLGRMDEEGFLYVTGRLKDLIITGGENVSPEEVERVLQTHPSVAEVGVFGIPDPRWGERVAAAVVVTVPVTKEELVDLVGNNLARFKCPRSVFFVDSLPKTTAGKVRRRALRERFGAESAGS